MNRVSPVEQSQMVGRGLAPLQASAFGSSLLLSSALSSSLGVGSNLYNLLAQIRDHEVTHVIVLKQVIQALAERRCKPCDYNFPVTSADTFLQVAQALENTGVSAYDGAINMVTNPAIVQAGATIATVEARGASFLNLIAGGGFAANGSFQPSTATPPAGTPPGVSSSPFPTALDRPPSHGSCAGDCEALPERRLPADVDCSRSAGSLLLNGGRTACPGDLLCSATLRAAGNQTKSGMVHFPFAGRLSPRGGISGARVPAGVGKTSPCTRSRRRGGPFASRGRADPGYAGLRRAQGQAETRTERQRQGGRDTRERRAGLRRSRQASEIVARNQTYPSCLGAGWIV